ncbi:sigma-70 family RNA polymerase sigma factor [bacterium]|nr:sigma-70 family RNA polymerase sigma factor [bacterium]
MNDEELIKRVAQKDRRAFEELVNSYRRLVFNVCLRLTGDRETAEDLAQEVFFHVYIKAKTFRSKSKLSTWLYRIAVNRSLNYNRKNKVPHRSPPSGSFTENVSSKLEEISSPPSYSPEKSLENKEEKAFIRQTVLSLPEKQRTAFILYYWEELSYKEIAEILKTSLSSVESRIHRAKKTLREIFLERVVNKSK